MADVIKDGKGTGNLAEVTDRNKLQTEAITVSEIHDAVDRGKAWNVGTSTLTLTGDGTSHGLLYVKNTGTMPLFIDLYVILTDASTGGSGNMLVEILENPTAGTLVSDQTALTPTNMNFGDSDTPIADIFSGGQGKTITGEDSVLRSQTTASNRLLLGILTKLPKSTSVALRLTTPTSNTSMNVEAVMEMFEEIK